MDGWMVESMDGWMDMDDPYEFYCFYNDSYYTSIPWFTASHTRDQCEE